MISKLVHIWQMVSFYGSEALQSFKDSRLKNDLEECGISQRQRNLSQRHTWSKEEYVDGIVIILDPYY